MSNVIGQGDSDVAYWENQALRVVLADFVNGCNGHDLADNGVCLRCGDEFVTVTVSRRTLNDAKRISSIPLTIDHFGPVLAVDREIDAAESLSTLLLGTEHVDEDKQTAHDGY